MTAFALTLIFLAALAVAACVVMAFSPAIERMLGRLMPEEMSLAWAKYAKFGLFVAALMGGLRFRDMETIINLGREGELEASRSLLEIFKAVAGTLAGGAWTLLLFFAATLAIYAGTRVYGNLWGEPKLERAPAGRL